MKKLTLFFLILVFSSVLVIAQSGTGRLTGVVSSSAGVLPGASAVLTDTKTGKERTSVTNGEGGFNFALLDYGEYTLKISAKGFKSSTTTITIQADQEYSLPVTLEVGNVSENVTVTAGADIVNSTN